jgi:DNA-binding HxlR family transcriptional regulator
MRSTHEKVGYLPDCKRPDHSAESAADGVGEALKILEGRWKMVIIFHLFARGVLRFSELERAIPAVSQKMLSQHLRELERDGVVQRTVYPVVPPKVEYDLTELGKALCPALDAILKWTELRRASAAARPAVTDPES